jgi:ParE toxin of type II toxin-antitoxin system, parDE
MRVVFSTRFRDDLSQAREHYRRVSERLADDFSERVKSTVRTVITWEGGDHVGVHGFPCRRCRPFPYLVYYEVSDGMLHLLGLVHERRHPDHLKAQGKGDEVGS